MPATADNATAKTRRTGALSHERHRDCSMKSRARRSAGAPSRRKSCVPGTPAGLARRSAPPDEEERKPLDDGRTFARIRRVSPLEGSTPRIRPREVFCHSKDSPLSFRRSDHRRACFRGGTGRWASIVSSRRERTFDSTSSIPPLTAGRLSTEPQVAFADDGTMRRAETTRPGREIAGTSPAPRARRPDRHATFGFVSVLGRYYTRGYSGNRRYKVSRPTSGTLRLATFTRPSSGALGVDGTFGVLSPFDLGRITYTRSSRRPAGRF